MPRALAPDDLYKLRVPTDPRISPDGSRAIVTVQTSAPKGDGYRHALWVVPLDAGAGEPRQLTLGTKNDSSPRWSPDGRSVAFLSDRRHIVEEEPDAPDKKEREDGTQVYLLSLDGGEARRLTDLPRGVGGFEWSPDGSKLVVTSTSHRANRKDDRKARGLDRKREPADPLESDYRYIDRLGYMFNGPGFIYDQVAHLWIVDVATGEATRLTDGPTGDEDPAWSPDGTRIAFATRLNRDYDIYFRSDIVVIDVASGKRTRITGGPEPIFFVPAWLPDGRTIAVLGGRLPHAGYRNDIWLFSADGREATPNGGRNISARHDIMPGSAMNSDITPGEGSRVIPSSDGRWLSFLAPREGAYQLWRIGTEDGALEQLTDGRHYLSSFDQVEPRAGRPRIAAIRSAPTELADVWVRDGHKGDLRQVTSFNAEALADVELTEPIERHVTVDGRDIQGWFIPGRRPDGARKGARLPLVTQIHGGPHTLYGWSPFLEFQILAATGMGVFYSNPRGSEGYGLEFNEANLRDWGPGPMRDVLAGVESLVADGLADPQRLGLTGGSYGGYLTNWIIAHDQRFAAAMTCRSVSDVNLLFLTGDISGGDWAKLEFGTTPWDDPAYFDSISPLTYADGIRTPLLIQHSERDIRTTVGQAEALFTVLRSKKRPVRLMRVPEETHELTRSGTPYRRAENLVQVRNWFKHFLVDGKRSLPPLPKVRAGR
ncbi:MAG TPA: S9 family peptidase [Candidatus Limnocylindrales bacterium]|nr:S9 family peptidase [Candidatus Limnocylindrales bacterium]